MKYVAFDRLDNNFDFFDTKEEAIKFCKDCLDYYADSASEDGWEEDMDGSIGYAEIKELVKEKIIAEKKDYSDEDWEEAGYSLKFTKVVDYELMEQSNEN